MDLIDAQEFVYKTKQPLMYFDHNGERYRFQNLEIKEGQSIYKYLSPTQEVKIQVNGETHK